MVDSRIGTVDDTVITRYEIGRAMFHEGRSINHCATNEQMDGWEEECKMDDPLTEIERVIAAEDENLTAWQIGYLDASEHRPFAPEVYYVHPHKTLDYAYGFHECNGSLIAADYITVTTEYLWDLYDAEHEQRANLESLRWGI